MTIIVWFHQCGYRTFNDYYPKEVAQHLGWAFPKLVSYNRFVELVPSALFPLCCDLYTQKGSCSGISFIDSLPVAVCHNRRLSSHKVFSHQARRGQNSVDWFYGFKLHFIVNDKGELLAFRLTAGNGDARKPVPEMVTGMFGKLLGDKGYLSHKLCKLLFTDGLKLVTKIKRTMNNQLMPLFDKLMLRKRAIIETIGAQRKNISPIEQTRHRSVINFLVNIVAALIAYSRKEKKPSLKIQVSDLGNLPVLI